MQNSLLISSDSEDKSQPTYSLQNMFYQYIHVNLPSLLFALLDTEHSPKKQSRQEPFK